MSATAEQRAIPSEVSALRARERRTFAITTLITLALVAAIVAFLAYAADRLRTMQAELSATETALAVAKDTLESTKAALADVTPQLAAAEAARDGAEADAKSAMARVADLETRLDAANAQLAELSEQIKLSVDYAQHLHPVDWQDAKELYSTSDRIGAVLDRILAHRQDGLRFSIANSPDKGFTSPGFANYVLGEVGLPPLGELKKADAPALGDIVLYDGGFALFYFKDHKGKPFVIGMTPVGIAALDPDFGVPQAGVRATGIMARR